MHPDPRYVNDAPECPCCGEELRCNFVGTHCDNGCDADGALPTDPDYDPEHDALCAERAAEDVACMLAADAQAVAA